MLLPLVRVVVLNGEMLLLVLRLMVLGLLNWVLCLVIVLLRLVRVGLLLWVRCRICVRR